MISLIKQSQLEDKNRTVNSSFPEFGARFLNEIKLCNCYLKGTVQELLIVQYFQIEKMSYTKLKNFLNFLLYNEKKYSLVIKHIVTVF